MVSILGLIELPLYDLVLMSIIFFMVIRWYVSRMITTHKVSMLYISKNGIEARMFPAEESIPENRVSLIKKIGLRQKEKQDFQKAAGPLNIYYGSRRETIYKTTEGLGKTTSWFDKTDAESMPSLIYEETGKFRTMVSNLSNIAMKDTKGQIMNIIMGVLMGMVIMLLLGVAFPQAF